VLNTSKLCKNLSLYGGVCSPTMRCVNARERSELMQEQCMPHCARRLHQEISQAHVRPLPRASFSFPKPPAPSHIQQAPPRHGSAGQMTPSTACIVRFNCLEFSSRAVSNRTCRDNHQTDFAPFIQNSPVEYRWPRTQTGSIVAGVSLASNLNRVHRAVDVFRLTQKVETQLYTRYLCTSRNLPRHQRETGSVA
jgi:hypothetical protein